MMLFLIAGSELKCLRVGCRLGTSHFSHQYQPALAVSMHRIMPRERFIRVSKRPSILTTCAYKWPTSFIRSYGDYIKFQEYGRNNNKRMFGTMIQNCALPVPQTINLNEALCSLAYKGELEAVDLLLKCIDVNCNAKNALGHSALKNALWSNNPAIVRLFLKHPLIDVNYGGDGASPLAKAVSSDKSEMVELFLGHSNIDVNSAFCTAVGANNLALVKRFLAHTSMNLNLPCNQEAFLSAARVKNINPDILSLLHNNGLNINAKDEYGTTPLLITSARSHAKTVQLFLDYGSDINAKNYEGDTALMVAIKFNHSYPEVAELLLQAGIDVSIRNKENMTAFGIARVKKRLNHMELLTKWSAAIL